MFPKGMSGATHEVIQYLIINLRRDNLVFFDPLSICADLDISQANCKKVKAAIIANDLMRHKTGGAYLFNPLYACLVTGNERIRIYDEYIKLKEPKKDDEGDSL